MEEAAEAFERRRFRVARAALEALAHTNTPLAHVYLGLLHWMGKGGFKADAAAAAVHFEAAARAGSPVGLTYLALTRLHAKAEELDPEQAVEQLERAAALGSRDALFFLGDLIRRGLGAAQDFGRALDLWREAAERGCPRAMQALGAALADGRGAPPDAIEGLAWLYAAASIAGDEEAVAAAKFLAQRMSASDIAKGHSRGRAFAKRFSKAWAGDPPQVPLPRSNPP
jgi:hypothetical protein